MPAFLQVYLLGTYHFAKQAAIMVEFENINQRKGRLNFPNDSIEVGLPCASIQAGSCSTWLPSLLTVSGAQR